MLLESWFERTLLEGSQNLMSLTQIKHVQQDFQVGNTMSRNCPAICNSVLKKRTENVRATDYKNSACRY